MYFVREIENVGCDSLVFTVADHRVGLAGAGLSVSEQGTVVT